MAIGNNLITVRPIPDFTGSDPDYKVTNELHELSKTGEWTFTVNFGAFHAQGFVVRDKKTGRVMRLGVGEDYRLGAMQAEPTMKSLSGGVMSCVTLNKEKLGGINPPDVYLDYQYVGGKYGSNCEAIVDAITDLQNKPVEMWWSNVLQKPIAYPPMFHTHHASTITGLSPTNLAIVMIPLALQEMAEVMERERVKIPDNIVTYNGVQKITIDKKGIILDPTVGSIVLTMPRSTTENARIGLRVSYNGIPINISFTEDGNTGVVAGSGLVDTELKVVNGIGVTHSCDLKAKVQYLTLYGTFKANPLILEQALVFIDEPAEFTDGYEWIDAAVTTAHATQFNVSSLWDRAPVFDKSGDWQFKPNALANHVFDAAANELLVGVPIKLRNTTTGVYTAIRSVVGELTVFSGGTSVNIPFELSTQGELVSFGCGKYDAETGCNITVEALGVVKDRWVAWFKLKGINGKTFLPGDAVYTRDVSILTPVTAKRAEYQGEVALELSGNTTKTPFTSVIWFTPITAYDTKNFNGKNYVTVIAEARQGLATVADLNRYLPLHGKADDALHADRADNATRAVSAANADHAKNADNATHAKDAENAVAAIHANTASVADNANTAQRAINADNAKHATTANSSTTANRATTAGNADNANKLEGSTKAQIIAEASQGVNIKPELDKVIALVNGKVSKWVERRRGVHRIGPANRGNSAINAYIDTGYPVANNRSDVQRFRILFRGYSVVSSDPNNCYWEIRGELKSRIWWNRPSTYIIEAFVSGANCRGGYVAETWILYELPL